MATNHYLPPLFLSTLLGATSADAGYLLSSQLVADSNQVTSGALAIASDRTFFELAEPPGFSVNTSAPGFSIADDFSGTSFRVFETTYDTLEGVAPNITKLDTTNSNVAFEAGTVGQDHAFSSGWGFDTGSVMSMKSNAALFLDFSASTTPVYAIAANLLDFEGGNSRPAWIGIYDALGGLDYAESCSFPATDGSDQGYGDGVVRQFIIESTDNWLGYIGFFVGDDNGGNGFTEQLALSNLFVSTDSPAIQRFSSESVTAVPLPPAAWLFASGLAAALISRRRCKKQTHATLCVC